MCGGKGEETSEYGGGHPQLGLLLIGPGSPPSPTLSPVPRRSDGRLHDYGGDRSARHLKDWALGMLPKHVKAVNRLPQLDDFLQQCTRGGGGGGAGAGASGSKWGVCALLLTDKHETSPLYKSLALRWGGWWAGGRAGGRVGVLVGGLAGGRAGAVLVDSFGSRCSGAPFVDSFYSGCHPRRAGTSAR